MAFRAEIKADSISPDGCRLTSFEATYPRIVHSEVMTHRASARNSASTRAIPIVDQLYNLLHNPFVPEKLGINQKGMQASQDLSGLKHEQAVEIWLTGRDRAVTTVLELLLGREIAEEVLQYESNREFVPGEILLQDFDKIKALLPKSTDTIDLADTSMLNVHKQLAGRGLEAYMWHTIVWSMTETENFFALRDHKDAQGEIATIARLMRQAYEESEPRKLDYGEWHLPYVEEGEFEQVFDGIRASGARAAATSYNRQNNKNPAREFERYGELVLGWHMSPLEHQATPFSHEERGVRKAAQRTIMELRHSRNLDDLSISQMIEGLEFNGPFRGFTQQRKRLRHESNFGAFLAEQAAA